MKKLGLSPADTRYILLTHGWVDDTFARLEKLKHRRPDQPHPFVIGQEKYRQYEDVFRKMAQEAIGKYKK